MGAVFAALMALELLVDGLPTVFSSVMAFPFEQVGAANNKRPSRTAHDPFGYRESFPTEIRKSGKEL